MSQFDAAAASVEPPLRMPPLALEHLGVPDAGMGAIISPESVADPFGGVRDLAFGGARASKLDLVGALDSSFIDKTGATVLVDDGVDVLMHLPGV